LLAEFDLVGGRVGDQDDGEGLAAVVKEFPTDIKYMSVPHRFRIFLVAKKACLQYMHFSGGEWQPQKPAEFEIPILPGDIRNASVSLPDDPGKLFCTNFTLIS